MFNKRYQRQCCVAGRSAQENGSIITVALYMRFSNDADDVLEVNLRFWKVARATEETGEK